MRLSITIAAVLALAGCQRGHAPLPPVAAPAAVATASVPMPAVEVLDKVPVAKHKKPAQPVLAPIVKSGSRDSTRRTENGGTSDDDPCAGLDDAALDDCLARDTDQTGGGRDYDRRPELDPRDRELIDAEEAADRDRGAVDRDDADVEGADYPPPDDDPLLDDDVPPEDDLPDEYPPDENADDPYNR
jgi:hypothetical protein